MKTNQSVIQELESILGPSQVFTDIETLDRFSGDALEPFRAFHAAAKLQSRPEVAVRPVSTQQVSQVVALANSRRIPVVPYGGGTGVMGGAVAVEGCIVLDLKGMNKIRQISKEDRTVRVESGVVLKDLENGLTGYSLMLGHDPWSFPIATVGGAISTNSVGYRAAKYGSMGQQVRALEVVLADGSVIKTREVPKVTGGPNLIHIFIGSEGTLGVVTSAVLRVFPQPEERVLKAIQFDDFEEGFRALVAMCDCGVQPAMVDFGEELPERSDGKHENAVLYLAFEGFKEEVEAHTRRTVEICLALGGRLCPPSEAQWFWDTRHSIAEKYKREVLESSAIAQARRQNRFRMEYLHVALPVSKVVEYKERCSLILDRFELRVQEWSIWARPEFLSFLIAERNPTDGAMSEVLARAVDEVLTLAHQMGGTMEYCHGVGIKLAHLMEKEWGTTGQTIRQIKAALDPHNILNPGKLGL